MAVEEIKFTLKHGSVLHLLVYSHRMLRALQCSAIRCRAVPQYAADMPNGGTENAGLENAGLDFGGPNSKGDAFSVAPAECRTVPHDAVYVNVLL